LTVHRSGVIAGRPAASEHDMTRAATDVMQSIIFSAVLDAVEALKAGSRGLPNQLVRDLQSIHPNTTFADLPKELQDAIAASTRAAFTQLLKEGYAVGPRQQQQATRPLDRVPDRRGPGSDRRGPGPERRPRRPKPLSNGPEGKGPGKGPGGAPRRPRPQKGKPRLS
jgi:hypothetical protein